MTRKLLVVRIVFIYLVLVFCFGTLAAQTVEELVNAGFAAYKQGDYKTAIEKFKRAIQKKPDLTSYIYFLLGDSYEKVGDEDNAIRVYEMVADRFSSTVLLRLIDLYIKKGNYAQAERIIDKMVEKFPESIAVYLRLGRVLAGEGQFEKAISFYRKSLTIKPDYREAYKELGEILIQTGKLTEANELRDTLSAKFPNSVEIQFLSAKMNTKLQQYDKAIAAYEKILVIHPNSIESLIEIAKIYKQLKLHPQAITAWERALKLDPKIDKSELIDLCIFIGSQYTQEGKIDDAIRYYLKLDSLGVSDAELHIKIGKLFYQKGDFKSAKGQASAALNTYKKAIEANPLNSDAYYRSGIGYLVMNDLANAEAEFQKYLNRTKVGERGSAAKMVEQLVAEGVNVPDASYILKKYFAGVVEKPRIVVSPTIEPAVRDTIPPQIVVLSPTTQRGMKIVEVSSYGVPIAGIASDDKGVSMVYINGIVAQLSAPTADEITRAGIKDKAVKFISEAMLTIGDNPVEIRVIDISGNVAKETVKVHRSTTVISEKKEGTRVKLPKIWAVVVGISRYENKELNLSFADKDAQSFYGFLKSPIGGAVPDEQMELLTNRNATRAEIIRAINQKLRLAFEDDEVILYFACHGIPDEVSNEVYFMSYDADPSNLAGTGIAQSDIQKSIFNARAKKVLFIADACHSGSVGLSTAIAQRGNYAYLTNKLLQQLSETRDGVAILTASSASEFSQEGKQWDGHGVFTYHLVHGLNGKADKNDDGTVTFREIYEYVYDKVARDTEGRQHPAVQGKFDNNLPLSVIK